ncbi:helix-turn-helix transcriptional regulator [Streptomyces sp. NBC_00287]|uniref:helix-turn-helix domain-containing protein n=1 Tax=Streptomyces sp. NBC_00287 TaxID=2975702 RepID=UPI002E2BEA7F|nr:helix-turn-helix transcriptional regulator [Streptomyces sp. NBC_00287]
MAARSHPTARQVRLGSELRKLREAAGLKSREVAAFLNTTPAQMSQVEAGIAAVSAERIRRLAAHCACADEVFIDALAAMAGDRTRGWWEDYRRLLPPVFMDSAEAEHHAKFLREIAITRIPGLLQTPDYSRAVFAYMNPELPENEVALRVEHRMRRRAVIEGDNPTPYEAIIHEVALRLRVSDRESSRAQLRQILDMVEQGHASVRVIPIDQDGFAGSGASMVYVGGPLPRLDTGVRDSPTGAAFIDGESQLARLRALIRRVESASLDSGASRDFIHRLAKEL